MSKIYSTPNPLSKQLAPLDNQIKVDSSPIPRDKKLIYIISGRKGSGKSNLILNLITKPDSPVYKSYDNIILISPSARRDEKYHKLVKELEKHDNFFEELNEAVITHILDKLRDYNDQWKADEEEWNKNKKETGEGFYTREATERVNGRLKKVSHKIAILPPPPNHLLILDDCLHMMPRSTDKNIVNSLWTNHRHSKLSIWVATQNYNKGANTLVRNNADLLTVYRTENKHELDTIKEDLNIDKEVFDRVYDYATNEPYSFLHVNLSGGKGRPVFYKKFDEIHLR